MTILSDAVIKSLSPSFRHQNSSRNERERERVSHGFELKKRKEGMEEGTPLQLRIGRGGEQGDSGETNWNLRANSSALRRRDPLAEEEGEGPGIPGALNKVASASNSTPQRRAETRRSCWLEIATRNFPRWNGISLAIFSPPKGDSKRGRKPAWLSLNDWDRGSGRSMIDARSDFMDFTDTSIRGNFR